VIPDKPRLGGQPEYQTKDYTVIDVIRAGETAGLPGIADDAISVVDWGYDPGEQFQRGGPLFPGRIGTIGVIPCYEAMEGIVSDWNTPVDLDRLGTALLLPADARGIAPNRRWDVVLIDTPPGGSKIHVQAAKGAHHVLFVAPPAQFAARGVPKTMALVKDIKVSYKHAELDVLGLVINSFVQNRKRQQAVLEDLERGRQAGDELFRAPQWPALIPNLGVIEDSQNAQAPVSAFLGAARDRNNARRVCQAAESHAIHLLRGIRHPQAGVIDQAWRTAWPAEHRADFMGED
jgi:chromosome partitioning protein